MGGGVASLTVPARFLAIAELVCRHREPTRYDLLYTALLRLQKTPKLLEIASDPLVRRLGDMERAVRRDRHKMTAFVRFREISTPDGARYVAWFEPAHFIEELAAPFFVDRFASMRFAILTPRVSMCWDGELHFGPGARREDVGATLEKLPRAPYDVAFLDPPYPLDDAAVAHGSGDVRMEHQQGDVQGLPVERSQDLPRVADRRDLGPYGALP